MWSLRRKGPSPPPPRPWRRRRGDGGPVAGPVPSWLRTCIVSSASRHNAPFGPFGLARRRGTALDPGHGMPSSSRAPARAPAPPTAAVGVPRRDSRADVTSRDWRVLTCSYDWRNQDWAGATGALQPGGACFGAHPVPAGVPTTSSRSGALVLLLPGPATSGLRRPDRDSSSVQAGPKASTSKAGTTGSPAHVADRRTSRSKVRRGVNRGARRPVARSRACPQESEPASRPTTPCTLAVSAPPHPPARAARCS